MNITMANLREKLREIDWEVDVDSLKDEAPLVEQGLDSLDMITLLFCVEKEFPVKIPDDDVDGLKSLKDFVAYINERI